ncbi:proline dehydrogenase 1, mitochondrial isoform X6 [Hippopotamus amphibius kiboko]|uniref:proline dehydrogenase 1, mitochondrial isoform X6 n=1 Tax=Hippopotamus amphibius kiboko TaxID=575201 RepID=UPI002593C70A|nr:proline dehydrogenase 1, mitochondrial isoform X6 [Hippopotamus amphibius kiboko]
MDKGGTHRHKGVCCGLLEARGEMWGWRLSAFCLRPVLCQAFLFGEPSGAAQVPRASEKKRAGRAWAGLSSPFAHCLPGPTWQMQTLPRGPFPPVAGLRRSRVQRVCGPGAAVALLSWCSAGPGGASDDGFLAIKLTALGRPQFLLQFSDVLTKWRRFFHQMATEQGKAGLAALDTKLEVAALQERVLKMGTASRTEVEDWFTVETPSASGTLDLLAWGGLIDSRTELSKHLVVPNTQTGQLEPLLSGFTEEDERQRARMLQRMDVLAQKASAEGVRLMVDAEQSYFQPAISRLTLELQRRFNAQRPLVFNTYQCYLQDAYDNVTLDVELARREGWCFGAKLVRGAYMAQERARALEVGCEDPINPTYEATNAMYHRCLNYILEELKHNAKAAVMVASHNEDTVRFTLCSRSLWHQGPPQMMCTEARPLPGGAITTSAGCGCPSRFRFRSRAGPLRLTRMEELGLHPADRQVYFGQLLGMCDHISFLLGELGLPGAGAQGRGRDSLPVPPRAGQAGFPAYKYVPYGPVMEVLPYLSRRAQENSAVMEGTQRERQLLWRELKRRLRTGSLFHRWA